MGFWFQLLIYGITTIISALIPRSQENRLKAPSQGDFSFPTAEEGRVKPLVFGRVRLRGPNVIWYGDLKTEAITKDVGPGGFIGAIQGLFGGGDDEQVIGYRVFFGVQLALSAGTLDAIHTIYVDEDVLWTGDISTVGAAIDVDKPEFFGGTEGASANGGFVGTFRFYPGTNEQPVNPYLAQFQNPLPAYRNTAHVVLEQGYIGNNTSIKPWSFEVSRYPNTLGLTDDKHIIGQDANPIAVLYELFNDSVYGLSQGVSKFNTPQWVTAAETLFDEGFGFSWTLDSPRESLEIAEEIFTHVDCVVYTDLSTEKINIKLIRQDYDIAMLPVFDLSNTESIQGFTRSSWEETVNQVIVKYADRSANYTERHAIAQDMANARIQGRVVSRTINATGAKLADVANRFAWRELRSVAVPGASAAMMSNREARELNPGDPFVINWPPFGITGLVCRVQKANNGTPSDQVVRVDWREDIFALENAAYSAPQPTGWVAPSIFPRPAFKVRLLEMPYQLSLDSQRHIAALVARDGGLHQGYQVWADLTGGTDFAQTNTYSRFTPLAALNTPMGVDHGDVTPYKTTITLTPIIDVTIESLEVVAAAPLGSNSISALILIDNEWLAVESVTANGTNFDLVVLRGMLDSVPSDHIIGTDIWFVGLGASTITQSAISDFVSTVNVKILPFTDRGTLDIAAAAEIMYTRDNRYLRPIPPADPQVNGNRFVDLDGWPTTDGVIEFTWKGRNRFTQGLGTTQDAASLSTTGIVTTNVEIKRVDNDVTVLSRSGIPTATSGGTFNAFGYVPRDAGMVAETLEFYALMWTRTNSVNSQAWRSPNFTIIEPDTPPSPIDPIPGVDVLRELNVTFSGAPVAADTLLVNIIFFGPDGVFNQTFTVTGEISTVDLATNLQTQLDAVTDMNFVDNIDISIAGSVVTLSSFFGTLAGSVSNEAGEGSANVLQEAKSPDLGRTQAAFADFWDTATDPNTGSLVDVLAPSSGPEYDANTTTSITVSGLTHAARVALNPANDGRPVGSRTFGIYLFGPLVLAGPHSTLNNLRKFRDVVQLSGTGLSDFVNISVGQNTSLPTNDDGDNVAMARPAAVITPVAGYRIQTTGPQGTLSNSPSSTTHTLLYKQTVGAIVGEALEQIIDVRYFKGVDDLATGQIYSLILDGTPIDYTITAADVALEGAASLHRDPVMEHFASNLPAGYSGQLIQGLRPTQRSDGRTFYYSNLFITRDAVDTPFTFDTQVGLGATATVETN